MEETLPTVTTVEVTQAVRDTSVDGVAVSLGDYIALLDDKLVITAKSPKKRCGKRSNWRAPRPTPSSPYIEAPTPMRTPRTPALPPWNPRTPGLQVDQVYGGQPHYHYLASIE